MSTCSVFDASFENCLADLRVSELLRLKHSVQRLESNEQLNENILDLECPELLEKNSESPLSMALVAAQRGYDTHAHSNYEPWQPEEKPPSKLQILFQISVTALAFLSFGGYLLCLIVQSIKSKGSTFFHPPASTMATMNGRKRIKVYRRSRRSPSPTTPRTQQNYLSEGQRLNFKSNNPYQYYETKYD